MPLLPRLVFTAAVLAVAGGGLARVSALGGAILISQEPVAAIEERARQAEKTGNLQAAFDLWLEAHNMTRPGDFSASLLYIQNPAEVARRERLATLAAKLSTAPVLPDDVERLAMGAALEIKEAGDDIALENAGLQLYRAAMAAPWVPALAFNLALLQEKLGALWNAADNLRVYLASDPPDAAQIKTRLQELEYRVERGNDHFWIDYDIFHDGERAGQTQFIVGKDYATVVPSLDRVFAINYARDEVLRLSDRPGVFVEQIPLAEYGQSGERFRAQWGQSNAREWNRNNRALAEGFELKSQTARNLGTKTIAAITCTDLEFIGVRMVFRFCIPPAFNVPSSLARGLEAISMTNIQWNAWAHFGRLAFSLAKVGSIPLSVSLRLEKEIPAGVASTKFPRNVTWTARSVTRGLTIWQVTPGRIRVIQRETGRPAIKEWGTQ